MTVQNLEQRYGRVSMCMEKWEEWTRQKEKPEKIVYIRPICLNLKKEWKCIFSKLL